jgi:Ca2+-binding EF-hand superfamily protein
MQEEKLTDLQVAEIKKAFSICDKDGSGSIDLPELKTGFFSIRSGRFLLDCSFNDFLGWVQ